MTESGVNYVYLVRCADGTLYCGWTTDLQARLAAHNSGRGAKYTRSRLPVEPVYAEEYGDRHEALSRECRIKRMSRAEKEKLIAGAENRLPLIFRTEAGRNSEASECPPGQTGP